MDTWRERLAARMAELKMTDAELGRVAGLKPSYLHDKLKRGQEPTIKKLTQIAHAVGMSVAQLVDGDEANFFSIPIIANIDSRGASKQSGSHVKSVSLKLDEGEAVAVEVVGDHLAPVYRNGDMLLGAKRASAAVDNLIGLECIICTVDDEYYVRYLARGRAASRYTLRAHLPHESDVEDVKVKWAAPVVWVRRGPPG